MASNEQIMEEANYYLNNDVTLKQASSDLGVSLRTLQLHLQKLEGFAKDTFVLVQDKKNKHIEEGRIKGGTIGKRKPTWDYDDARIIAKAMIEKGMTFEEASQNFDFSKSTLHEMAHSVSDPELKEGLSLLFEANRKKISVDEYVQNSNDNNRINNIINDDNMENATSKGKR